VNGMGESKGKKRSRGNDREGEKVRVGNGQSHAALQNLTQDHVQGAANKSNLLPCFVNMSTTNTNFYKKIYTTIWHSYLRAAAEFYYIITTFD